MYPSRFQPHIRTAAAAVSVYVINMRNHLYIGVPAVSYRAR